MSRRSPLDLFLVVRTPDGARRAVAVRISPDSPARELLEHLAQRFGLDPRTLRLHAPGGLPARGDTVAGLGLRTGAELWLVADRHPRLTVLEGRSPWELVVVGGPFAGRRFPLRPGEQLMGRAANADIQIDDPELSRMHLRLWAEVREVVVTPASSDASTYLAGRPLPPNHRLAADEVLEAGHSLLAVRSPGWRPAPVEALPRGVRILPAPPAEPLGGRGPLAVLLGPVRRRQARRFRERLAEAEPALEWLRRREAATLRDLALDPAAVEEIGAEGWARGGPRSLRLGWGDVPSAVPAAMPGTGRADLREEGEALAARWAVVPAVPLTVDLGAGLGLVGPPDAMAGLARWLVVQAVVRSPPGELGLAALLPAAEAERWSWLAWLPHYRRSAQATRRRLVVAHEAAPAALLARLAPEQRDAGTRVLWLGAEPAPWLEQTATLTGSGWRLHLRRAGEPDVTGVTDQVSLDFAERLARRLSETDILPCPRPSPIVGEGPPP